MKVTILGSSKSGFSAAKLAKTIGFDVFVSEYSNDNSYYSEIEYYKINNIQFEFGGHTEKILDCDFAITSPGIYSESFPIKLLSENNIQIISEVEFAYQQLKYKNNIIAITGTNGKTTTTSLIAHIFKNAKKNIYVCGNIGIPFSDCVIDINELNNSEADNSVIIIETSSYQLDRIVSFTPKVGIFLNISPDHLTYHKTFQHYLDTKWKISLNMNENNLLILNKDDVTLMGKLNSIPKEELRFNVSLLSLEDKNTNCYVDGGEIITNNVLYFDSFLNKFSSINNIEELMNTVNLSLPGVHNIYNSLAAILASKAFEIQNEDIRDALMSFQGVEHRLELVSIYNNIKFINDSKATNVNSTWFALNSYDRPIIWIAGGRGDNNNYDELNPIVKKRVKHIISIGEESNNIFNHFSTFTNVTKVENLNEAIELSLNFASEYDVVLFSPACKSFDMFANFEHRGEEFKKIINNL